MRPKRRKEAAHRQQVERRAEKQRATRKAAVKRQRTRAQTPDLWKARKKGRAVRKRPPVVAIPRLLPLAA